MGSRALALLLFLFFCSIEEVIAKAQMRIHQGFIGVHDQIHAVGIPSTSLIVGSAYTFELYETNTMEYDYMIDSCTMNGEQFISPFGCVQCRGLTGVKESTETEGYARPGAMKRTLVHFEAVSSVISFSCQVNKYRCAGCAERSCERRPVLAGIPCIPTPLQCSFGVQPLPPSPPMLGAYPVAPAHTYPVAVIRGHNWFGAYWPWWMWLLLALLLLLLLLCCLACLLWAWGMKRKRSTKVVTTRIATVEENKSIGIGTDAALSTEKGVGTGGSLYKEAISTSRTERIIPAIVTDDGYYTHRTAYDTGYTRVGGRNNCDNRRDYRGYDTYKDGGAYSVREGKVINEKFTRTTYQNEQPSPPDRSSYRNYAYERDMGRVAPMSGFDEVETLERKHYMSDDDSEIIEKDIKRTHTTRFVSETRTVPDESDTSSEKYREEGEQHVVYAPNLRV